MLLSKITNCLFFFMFYSSVKCLIKSVLSRAGTGAVNCRLLCLRAPSNRATIPAHKSWLGLDFCYQEETFVIERENRLHWTNTNFVNILFFLPWSFADPVICHKKAALLIDPLPLRWCSCDGPPALLDDGDVASDVLADLLRCWWLLHEYPSVGICHLESTWVSIKFPKCFANFPKVR